jgi:hypothetical protein
VIAARGPIFNRYWSILEKGLTMTMSNFVDSIVVGIKPLWRLIMVMAVFMFVAILLTACSSPLVSQFTVFEDVLEGIRLTKNLLRVVAILPGLALLFMGRKIYRAAITLPGFLLGAILGAYLGNHLGGNVDLTLLGLSVGGLLGGWLASVLHKMAVVVIGAVGGVYIVTSMWELIYKLPPPVWIVIIVGIVSGFVLFAIAKRGVILLSSAVGATMITWGVGSNVVFVFFLFLVGVFFQYTLARLRGERPFRWPKKLFRKGSGY